MEDQKQLLSIKDLESVKGIIEAKLNELKLMDRSKGPAKQSPEQEHKAVSRVISDVIEILLSNFEAQEALPLYQNVFGKDISATAGQSEDSTKSDEQLLRMLTT